MLRLLVVTVIAALGGCAAPERPTAVQAAEKQPARSASSEPAPYSAHTDFRVSPDSRERLCGESQLANRDNSYSMLTKATTSYYCF
jgi:hypothetical protein